MEIAQRGASGTVGANTSAYTLDGWIITTVGAGMGWSQVFSSHLTGYALRLSAASGLTDISLAQRISASLSSQLLTNAKAPQPVTVQMSIYNGLSAAITPVLKTYTAGSQDNFGSVTPDNTTTLQTIAAGAIGVVALVFVPNVAIINGYQLNFDFGAALNGTSGFIDVGLVDFRSTPGVGVGLTLSAPPPEIRPFSAEIAMNRVYLRSTYGNGIAPGTSTRATMAGGSAYIGTPVACPILFDPPMRAAPALQIWDGVGNPNLVSQYAGGSWTDALPLPTIPIPGTLGPNGFNYAATSLAGATVFHYLASAEL